MTSAEFLDWAAREDVGRVELIDGEVVAMAGEQRRHAVVKKAIDRAFDAAIAAANAPCASYVDGLAVMIDDASTLIPDVLIDCGDTSNMESRTADMPTVVVEVLSPSTSYYDRSEKMAAYLSHTAIQHYLIVNAQKRFVIHHRRLTVDFQTSLLFNGALTLDPPGLNVDIADFWRGLPEQSSHRGDASEIEG